MTSKEQREYEEGRAYGYRHPTKVAGWFKSAAWNKGLQAGQAQYWREWKKEQARIRAYWRIRRRAENAGRGMGGAGKND